MTVTVKQLLEEKADSALLSVSPDTLVIDAIRIMDREKVGTLLVLERGKIVGVLSERDYTRKVILNNRSSDETRVSEIMTRKVKTVGPDNTVQECLILMSENHIRHLPVVANDNAISMLSIMDVVKNIISSKEMIIEQLENYITDTT